MVTAGSPSRHQSRRGKKVADHRVIGGRVVFIPVVALCLTTGLCGGLLRAGVALPSVISGAWLTSAVMHHAFLMICAFMGTVIGLERAVAVKTPWAYLAPAASAASGLFILAAQVGLASGLAIMAALAFVAVNMLVVSRQAVSHTYLLLLGALAWLAGNVGFAVAPSAHSTVPWWFAFLILTIAAERLEMTRLMRRHRASAPALYAVLAALLIGCALFLASPTWGGIVYGGAMIGLATWLFCFDIARRTVFADGLSRYMAVCLLVGYFWLAVAGISWCATSLGLPLMDAALHALALGFVFSMMLGHAPVILPAIARVKVHYSWAFYLPLALLHLSLLTRLLLRNTSFSALPSSALGNAVAILLFVFTVAGSAIAWRVKHSPKAVA